MKVLITGASIGSFLGNHVRKLFDKHRPSITPIYTGSEYDLTKEVHTKAMFEDFKPEVVVHMAAKCGGILANKNSPADFLRDNTQMGLNVYEAAREFGCKKVYTLGSVCSFPLNCPVPFKEDDLFNGFPEPTNAPYGQAKRTLLMLGQAYRKQYGIGGAHLIPVNLYGTFDHFDLVNSHVIPALINKFTHAATNDLDKVECWGSGVIFREFLFVEDCAEAIYKAVEMKLDTPDPINIGTGKDITIKNLATMIAELTGFKGRIEFTGEVSDGQPKRRLDVSRAKEILGFEAKTTLKEGLIKTIEWYKNDRSI